MKPVIEWIKTNWLVSGTVVLALAGAPTLYYLAGQMNADLRARVEKEVTGDYNDITKSKVPYEIPKINPDESGTSWSSEVNAVKTAFFATERAKVANAITQIKNLAFEFNAANRPFLVEGLFPAPSEEDRQVLPRQMVERFVAVHEDLLKSIGAGTPPAKQTVGERIDEYARRETRRLLEEKGGDTLSAADQKLLADELVQMRVGLYRQRAVDIKVFADISSFPAAQSLPNKDPGLATCWDWQEQYWIHTDICRAIAQANSDGASRGVPDAVIKRLIAVRVAGTKYGDSVADLAKDQGLSYDATGGRPWDSVAKPNYSLSLTGRWDGAGSGNKLYDVREVEIEAIVSTRRLPKFFDAISAQNFFTALSCTLSNVELLDELKNGYWYGDEPVVKAVMKFEIILLRTDDLVKKMPIGMRIAKGIPPDDLGSEPSSEMTEPAPEPAAPPKPAKGGKKSTGEDLSDLP